MKFYYQDKCLVLDKQVMGPHLSPLYPNIQNSIVFFREQLHAFPVQSGKIYKLEKLRLDSIICESLTKLP